MTPTVIQLPWEKVTFSWITDLHLSAVPPGKRSADYEDQMFDKLDFVRNLSLARNAVCLCGGDIFHVKGPKSHANSLRMINRLIALIKQYPLGKWYSCIGNHDIQYDRMDTVPNQPIGVLIESDVCHPLNFHPVIFTNNDQSVKVLVESFDYAGGSETHAAIKAAGRRPEGIDYRIGIIHASGGPGDSRESFGEWMIGYNHLQHEDFDLMLWGHDHGRIETMSVGNITHVHLGALSRAALTETEINRKISVPIISFTSEKASIKEVEVPVLPAEQIFRKEDKIIEKIDEDTTEVKQFFSAMSESVEGITSGNPIEVIEALCVTDKTLSSLVKDLCEY